MTTALYAPLVTDVFADSGASRYRVMTSIGINPPFTPQDSFYTNDGTPIIQGTALPGTQVVVYDNNTPIGTVTTGDDWYWHLTTTEPEAAGFHYYSATPLGDNTAAYGNLYSVLITHVLAPVITDVLDSHTLEKITEMSSTSDTLPTIKGTSQPYTIIDIFDNGVKIGQTAPPDTPTPGLPFEKSSWEWSFTPSQPLDANATHVFTAVAHANWPIVDDGGTPSEGSYTIGIGVTPAQPAPLAPVITSVVDDAGANQGTVTDGGQTNDVRPTLHGTSEPGTVVTVSDNGHVIGTATTGADWQWSFTPNTDLTAGTNTLSVSAARADGSGGSTAAWYTHVLDVTPSLDAVLATAGLSAAAAPAPTAQAAYVSEAVHTAAMLPQHDLAY